MKGEMIVCVWVVMCSDGLVLGFIDYDCVFEFGGMIFCLDSGLSVKVVV